MYRETIIDNITTSISFGGMEHTGICQYRYLYRQNGISNGEDGLEFRLNNQIIGCSQYADITNAAFKDLTISGTFIFFTNQGDQLTVHNIGSNTSKKDFTGFAQRYTIHKI